MSNDIKKARERLDYLEREVFGRIRDLNNNIQKFENKRSRLVLELPTKDFRQLQDIILTANLLQPTDNALLFRGEDYFQFYGVTFRSRGSVPPNTQQIKNIIQDLGQKVDRMFLEEWRKL